MWSIINLSTLFLLTDALGINQKFCITCKHFISDKINIKYARCGAFPEPNQYYFISGNESEIEYPFCSIARNYESICGKNATKYIE